MLLLAAARISPEPFPHVPVRTLSGRQLMLPGGVSGRDAVFVIGFTQTSEKQTVVWRKELEREFSADPRVVVYPVVVIQGIPGIFHGLLLSGIRAGVPKADWERFLVVARDDSKWKAAIGFAGRDIAYVLLVDPQGDVVWRARGAYFEAALDEIKNAIGATNKGVP